MLPSNHPLVMNRKNKSGSLERLAGDVAASLCASLGYEFQNPAYLELALTHSSFANEAGRHGMHNERQEFLGDAVLELCVSSELYHRFPEAREGELTRMRSSLVSEKSLAILARKLGLNRAILLGVGEERQGGRERDAILADAMEAVFAAIFLDSGFEKTREIIANLLKGSWPDCALPLEKDFKSRLQELCLARFHALPVYALESAEGPEHAKIFTVRLEMPDGQQFHGRNSSCRLAEQKAARRALEHLEEGSP